MRKQLKNRGMITFYVQPLYRISVLEKFLKLIPEDKRITKLQKTNRPNQIVSLGIIFALDRYNKQRKYELENNLNTEDVEVETEEVEKEDE
jgi:hypothetical protein